MSKKTKSLVLSVVAVLLVAALAVGAYFLYEHLKPKPQEGTKAVTVIVTDSVNGTEQKTYEYMTDAEYLADLLIEKGLADGSEGQYGFTIEAVNGITADGSKFQYWAIYVNGEYGNYGASEQPVLDGDTFELKLEAWQ